MRNNISHFILLGLLSIFAFSASAKDITCTIKGKVVGRDSKNILLYKGTTDGRANHIVIPIVNNTFEYTFTVPVSETYTLVFQDELRGGNNYCCSPRAINFFPVEGEVRFTLHDYYSFNNNKIEGGEPNKKWDEYRANLNPFLNRLESHIMPLLELTEKGEGEGPKAKAIMEELEKVEREHSRWYNKYIDENPSLIAYFLFTERLLVSAKYVNDEIRHRASAFTKLYPDHPYTKLVGNKIESLANIKVGGKYIDFSAPDLDGKVVKISDLLKEEFLLIDFWASWCGPCIVASRAIMPVYEDFKGNGFSIIGIARETGNAEAMIRTIEREKYPWVNLLELNDQNGIWDKYNLSYSGGGRVLLNKAGDIVAINPSAQALRELLQKELKR